MSPLAVDTSVAVALVVTSHRAHEIVSRYVGTRPVLLAAHAQLETYSVLTRLPGDARLAAADAQTIIANRFGDPIPMVPDDHLALLAMFASAGVVGGAVYDGVIGLTAKRAGLQLATRDRRAVPTFLALGVGHELMAD